MVWDELIKVMEKYWVIVVVGIVLDVKIGEVVVMLLLLDYDFNDCE